MSSAKTVAVVGAGLVGLYLLSGQAGGGSGGGFGGGGGADREPSDTIINFPEMDLSQLWGDVDVKKDIPSVAPDWWTEYVTGLEGRRADLLTYESQGMTPEQAQHVDMLRRKFGQIPEVAPVTKKLTPDTTAAFTLPFFGATGAPNFSTWMKTHNIYGKLITPEPIRTTTKKQGGSSVPFRSSADIKGYQAQGMTSGQAQHVDMLRRRFQ